VRKKIKEDPRYEKFSSSDRKCEREFDLYLKDLQTSIKNDYRELLMETKMLNYKSKVQVSENPGMLKDIVSMLSNDKRYHEMDSMADERSRLLLDFMDELERKGPPPPPTASEPARRNKT
jgi:transcription elongation regulator 1